MPHIPFRWWLAVAMTSLFLVSLARAEMRWAKCGGDEGEICFEFPNYLSYEVQQGLSVHGIALFPASIAHMLPGSISGERSLTWLRFAVSALSVFGVWWLIGAWWERLRNGFPAPRPARLILWPVVGIVGPALCFGVFIGIRGGWEGPTNTTAGFVMPVLLIGMALVELGVLQRVWRAFLFGTLIAAMVAGLAMWAEREFNFFAESAAAKCADRSFCPDPPFSGPPYLSDALMLSAASVFAGMGITSMGPEEYRTPIRATVIWLYWLLLHALATGRWPASSEIYRGIRPVLRVLVWGLFVMILTGWLFIEPNHGPTGVFGLIVGLGMTALALRNPTPSPSSTAQPDPASAENQTQ